MKVKVSNFFLGPQVNQFSREIQLKPCENKNYNQRRESFGLVIIQIWYSPPRWPFSQPGYSPLSRRCFFSWWWCCARCVAAMERPTVALLGGRPGLELRSSRELLWLEERALVDGIGTKVWTNLRDHVSRANTPLLIINF